MSDGGLLPWKRQNLKVAQAADYSSLQNPLPQLPNGSAWLRDPETREWKIINLENENTGIAIAIPIATPANDEVTKGTGNRVVKLPDDDDFVSHVVQDSDTLQGICLKVRNFICTRICHGAA